VQAGDRSTRASAGPRRLGPRLASAPHHGGGPKRSPGPTPRRWPGNRPVCSAACRV